MCPQLADGLSHRVALRLVHVGKLNATAHTKGTDMQGWTITKIHSNVYDSRACQSSLGSSFPLFLLPGSDANATAAGGVLPATLLPGERYVTSSPGAKQKKPLSCGDLPFSGEWQSGYSPFVLVANVMVRLAGRQRGVAW